MNRNRTHRSAIHVLRLVILAALALFAGHVDADERLNAQLDGPSSKAIVAASEYVDRGEVIDILLKSKLGYDHPGISEDVWREFPAVYKVETAYLAAEEHIPGSGERFLALLSKALAQQYANAAEDADLKSFITKAETDKIDRVDFAQIERRPGSRPPELSIAAMNAIDALARYCEGGPFGPRTILIEHFGLQPREAYELLRTHRSAKDALIAAVAKVGEPRANIGMTRLVSFLDENYLNARVEKAFDPWRQTGQNIDEADRSISKASFKWTGPNDRRPWDPHLDGPRPPDGSGLDGSAGKGPQKPPPPVKVREEWRNTRVKEYQKFTRIHYGTTGRTTYKSVVRSGRGFGGVVVGAEVTDNALPDVKAIRWQPSKADSSRGALVIEFERLSATLPNVLLEDVYSAHLIYYKGVDGKNEEERIHPANTGDAVGLVGISDPIPYYDCGPERIIRRGSRWKVVMHPAIADLDLGWSVLMTDVAPFPQLRERLLNRVAVSKGDKERDAILSAWTDEQSYTWKFTDVPMRLDVEEGRLILERPQPDGKNLSAQLRRTAFITFNAYARSDGTPDAVELIEGQSDSFYPLVPALIKASSDYERLNDFVQVCAVLRWAKSRSAEFKTPPLPPDPKPAAASLIVTDAGAVPAPAFEWADARKEQHIKVELRLATLFVKRPALKDFDRDFVRLSDEIRQLQAAQAQTSQLLSAAHTEFNNNELVKEEIAKAKDAQLLRAFLEVEKQLEAQNDALANTVSIDEQQHIEARIDKLITSRRNLLTDKLPRFDGLNRDIQRLKAQRDKYLGRADELNQRVAEPYHRFAQLLHSSKEPENFGELLKRVEEAELEQQTAAIRYGEARAKLVQFFDEEHLPKNSSAEIRQKYLALNESVLAVRKKKLLADDENAWTAAESEEKAATDRLTEFELKVLPAVAESRQELARSVKLVLKAQELASQKVHELHEAVRRRCPEIEYYLQLRELRANPFSPFL